MAILFQAFQYTVYKEIKKIVHEHKELKEDAIPLGEVIPPKKDTGFIVMKAMGIALGAVIILICTYLSLLHLKVITNCEYSVKLENDAKSNIE